MTPKGMAIRSGIRRMAKRLDAFSSRRSRVDVILYCRPAHRAVRHHDIEVGTGRRAGMLRLAIDVTLEHVADVSFRGTIAFDREGNATAWWPCWPPDADDDEPSRAPTPEEVDLARRLILAHASPAQRRVLRQAATWQITCPDALRYSLLGGDDDDGPNPDPDPEPDLEPEAHLA